MEGNRSCLKCGSEKFDIGEGTVFCCGCNALAGVVESRQAITWDPEAVSHVVNFSPLDKSVVLNAIQLQAKLNEAERVLAALQPHLAHWTKWDAQRGHVHDPECPACRIFGGRKV